MFRSTSGSGERLQSQSFRRHPLGAGNGWRSVLAIVVVLCAASPTAEAQRQDVLMAALKLNYGVVRQWLLDAAEAGSAELFAFRPSRESRTLGELVALAVETNYRMCGLLDSVPVSPMADDRLKVEKATATRALVASFAYCDIQYSRSGETGYGATVRMPIGDDNVGAIVEVPRLSVPSFHAARLFAHYGSVESVFRLKGLVPPSSQPLRMFRLQ